MELGLIPFADMQPERLSGGSVNAHQRIKDLLEEIKLAHELGLNVFGMEDITGRQATNSILITPL